MAFTTNKLPKTWGRVLHDPDLAEAIADRALERLLLIQLDGPSIRTRHIEEDALTADPPEVLRISGKTSPEFPEPTLTTGDHDRNCVAPTSAPVLGSEQEDRGASLGLAPCSIPDPLEGAARPNETTRGMVIPVRMPRTREGMTSLALPTSGLREQGSDGDPFPRALRRVAACAMAALVNLHAVASAAAPRTLSFEDRVEAQRAIERVLYEHRVWPKENPTPKPPFEKVMPQAAIDAKVDAYLRQGAALEEFWKRPLDARQLQAEMDRMARGTKDPATLRELVAALHGDPLLVAECMARPVLTDRLIHAWYAGDEDIHAVVRARAERALREVTAATFGSYGDGEHGRVIYDVAADHGPRADRSSESTVRISVDGRELRELRSRYGARTDLPRIEETSEAYLVVMTVRADADEIELATISFAKESFDLWWSRERDAHARGATIPAGGYSVPETQGSLAGCDDWASPLGLDFLGGRYGHSLVWTGTEMIVWGGNDGADLDSGARYTPSTDTFVATSKSGCPSARSGHTAVWTGTEMVVWGGRGNSGARYSPATDTWVATSTGANCPSARSGHTAVWAGTEMIVWGGLVYPSYFNTGGKYTPSTDTWVPTSTAAGCPSVRAFHTAVWTGTEMIVWGGEDTPTSYLNTGARYTPGTDAWVPTTTGVFCPPPRIGHTAVWTGTEMIVWGGEESAFVTVNTGSRYSPSTNSWAATTTAGSCPSAREYHTVVWTGAEMIVWGGAPDTIQQFNTGARYSPAADTWVPTSTGGACPSGRDFHEVVWTGTEMIVWGGISNGIGYLDTGGRYSPATDTWVGTSTTGACPLSTTGHSAIWSGAEMIVWGGYGRNTGGRYTPATDSWAATSTGAGCPAVYSDHTAVWTGTEMIVWGGNLTNTGGKYTPATDSWVATSTVGSCPSARFGHTAVWTGTEMIIWGGTRGSNGLCNTGGRYTPGTDSWVATSTAGACPSARDAHSAVWTGTEMVVWGGETPIYLNTGGRYSPATDTWVATSTAAGCPSTRGGHTGVWTGSEMIVWGGYPTQNTGGKYVPGTDTWTPTSATAAPVRRTGHSAVWTGTTMIIWGGLGDNSVHLGDGGRYAPSSDSWTPTAIGGSCPTGRHSHTAVWTGTDMIVWGGQPNGVAGTASGGIYLTSLLALSPATLPGGAVGSPYSRTITASGGSTPYTFSLASGAVPRGLTLSSSGVLAGVPTVPGTFGFTVQAADGTGCSGSLLYALAIAGGGTEENLAVGCGLGPPNENRVRVFTQDGTATPVDFLAYGAGAWGVNVARGDIDSSVTDRILSGPGPGTTLGPQVRAFQSTGAPLAKINFYAYGTLRYGVNAVATDVDGDSFGEILSGAGPGAVFGPHVRGWNFDGNVLTSITKISFFAYGTLRYGVNVTGGDVEPDGFGEIVTGPGPGNVFGPQVRGFDYDGASVQSIGKINFNAFGTGQFGVNLAAGDVDADATMEVICARGPGAGAGYPSQFVGFDYDGGPIAALPGFDVTLPITTIYGGRVGTGDVNGDGPDDLLAGAGRDPAADATSRPYVYVSNALVPLATFDPFPSVTYGVNVAGASLGY